MADEGKLSRGLRSTAKLKKTLLDSEKELEKIEKQLETFKQQTTALTQQNVQFSTRLANVAGNVTLNNQLVGALRANEGRMRLIEQASERAHEQMKGIRAKTNEHREAYIQGVLDLRKLADSIATQYKTDAADAEVTAAIAKLNAALGKSYEFTELRGYLANLKRLKVLEDTVLSESIPLRRAGGDTLYVSVMVNGKHIQEMVVDSGSSMICLPQQVAAKCGVEVKSTDPEIILQLADGSQIPGREVTISSIRVGKFTVENVKCAVLGPAAVRAEPLLGMSFLGNFKFEVNSQDSKLKMVKVETDKPGTSSRRP